MHPETKKITQKNMPYLTLTENLKLQLSALEALRNALYKCSTYLLTYLLTLV